MWPWKRKPAPLPIPPYVPPVIVPREPEEPAVEVKEVSTETGIHRFMEVFEKLKGKGK
jgi:hypothetical protein